MGLEELKKKKKKKIEEILDSYGIEGPAIVNDIYNLLEDAYGEGYRDGQDRYWKDY